MKAAVSLVIALSVVMAGYFTFFAPLRYGTYLDDMPRQSCTSLTYDTAKTEYRMTLAGYYILTEPIKEDNGNWGTCPYQHYKVRTVAVELWLLAGLGVLFWIRKC